jgi:hypothetical protein
MRAIFVEFDFTDRSTIIMAILLFVAALSVTQTPSDAKVDGIIERIVLGSQREKAKQYHLLFQTVAPTC